MKAVYKVWMGSLSGVFIAEVHDMQVLCKIDPMMWFGTHISRFSEWHIQEFTHPAAVSVVERLGLQSGVDLWDNYIKCRDIQLALIPKAATAATSVSDLPPE